MTALVDYQVYFLQNPITDEIFYVGMGRPGRIHQHVKQVERGDFIKDGDLKRRQIKNIQDAGYKVIENLIHQGLSKNEASALERMYVAKIGRIDKGTGSLTNKTSGGAGSRDAIRTAQWKSRQSASGKIAQNRPEVIAKKSSGMLGKKRTPEQMVRVLQSRPGIIEKLSEQRQGGGNPSAKKWLINGTTYSCGKEAAAALGLRYHELKRQFLGCQLP
jgi:hypothetical protein